MTDCAFATDGLLALLTVVVVSAVFGGFVPHRSDPNTSDRWRRQLYLSYSADSDGGDRRDAHYREFHAWLKVKYAEYGKTDTYYE